MKFLQTLRLAFETIQTRQFQKPFATEELARSVSAVGIDEAGQQEERVACDDGPAEQNESEASPGIVPDPELGQSPAAGEGTGPRKAAASTQDAVAEQQ